MQTGIRNSAITALLDAGFEVIDFKKEDRGFLLNPLLKIKAVFDGPETRPLKRGGKEPDLSKAEAELMEIINRRRAGEIFDLSRVLVASDWRQAFRFARDFASIGGGGAGDFIRVSFEVPEAEYQGVKFEKLVVNNAMVKIVEIDNGNIIFNFDDILFNSAINAKDTNDGGFDGSALACYLNNEFLNAMGISDMLLANKNDRKITLLTAHELFGKREYWEEETNFQKEPHQMGCFKNEKNRVKSYEDETEWYWTSSARASSAAIFCRCGTSGYSSNHTASSVGGVAPAFCVAKATPL